MPATQVLPKIRLMPLDVMAGQAVLKMLQTKRTMIAAKTSATALSEYRYGRSDVAERRSRLTTSDPDDELSEVRVAMCPLPI